MDLQNVWTIARKDLKIFRTRRTVLYSTVIFPVVLSVGLPLVIKNVVDKSGAVPTTVLTGLLDSFAFFFMILAAVLPTAIASYSIVGEKVQKSMEPLLATPVRDSEILLGKMMSSILPPLLSIYTGLVVFMVLMDRFTSPVLGYDYFPNWIMGIVALLLIPTALLLSVEVSVILSSRLNDVRGVQQTGGLMVLPFAAIYVGSEVGIITIDTTNLLYIAGVIIVVDVVLFAVTRATFKREEILTRWR